MTVFIGSTILGMGNQMIGKKLLVDTYSGMRNLLEFQVEIKGEYFIGISNTFEYNRRFIWEEKE